MKNSILKKSIVFSLLLLLFSGLFAQNKEVAVVTYVKGKVEVGRNDTWKTLTVGDEISANDIVSTGFQSEARIKYNGSILSMGAVTRISISELAKTKGHETVNVNLSTGAVRSKVTHTEDTRVSYTVRTPSAVASVRGTDFLITDSGKVFCYEGAVVVYPAKYLDNKAAEEETQEEEAEETEESEETEASTAESSDESNATATTDGDSEEKPGAYGPANANTDANEIDTSAPSGAIVVGQNQSTQITSSGRPEKPMDNAEKQSQQVKNVGQTASEKETVSAGSNAPVSQPTYEKPNEELGKGSISVTVTFEN